MAGSESTDLRSIRPGPVSGGAACGGRVGKDFTQLDSNPKNRMNKTMDRPRDVAT